MHSVPTSTSAAPPAARLAYVPVENVHQGPDGGALLAREQSSGRLVELRYAKVAQHDEARWRSIERAAKTYALIEHDGYRRLLGRELIGGIPVLVFESLRERDLASDLQRGPLPEQQVWTLVWRLAQSLAAAHRLGLVHGRLGPSAVWLRDDGSPLLDFSWLDVGQPRLALDDVCAAPETRRAEPLDASSDVYSLGMLARVAALGREPRLSDVGAGGVLDLLIMALTAPERDGRPSMLEVCRELDQLGIAPSQSVATQQTLLSLPPGLNGLIPITPLAPRAGATLPALNDEPRRRSAAALNDEPRPRSAAALDDEPRRRSAAALDDARPAPRVGARQLAAGMRLGRYELLHKLGEGGMGEVYRALDRAGGQHVALKVLREDTGGDPGRLQRFRKEARILSELDSDYIARLIELNHDRGINYIALEFVDGGDLSQLLDASSGQLQEREALGIVADVCRGLAEAHARGIVHRDIKPQNIMLTRKPRDGSATRGQIKLCDFGIARALHGQTATLAYTQADTLLGTPDFMAPEQCNGQALTPATDVYALGVMLFRMLSGNLPFSGGDTVAILVAHVSKAAPELSAVCPDVSAATDALVNRMLAKAASDRFPDASGLLEAIERILTGDATEIEVHPIRPPTPLERITTHAFEWDLRASPDALWPFVSNTDRLNRAVGLPPALFERLPGAGAPATFGRNRVAGVSLRWQEHPFEWVEGRRWGVLRVFQAGVMCWYTVELELLPKPGGGTRLRYVMTLEPRHWFGRMMVALEMRFKQKAALARIFERIDAYLSEHKHLAPGVDAFEPPKPLSPANRHTLQRSLERLRDDGVDPELLEALAMFCADAPDQEVAHLRPLVFARTYGLDPDRTVDACLRGAHHGLFVLLWEVLCPLCRVASGFAESLRALADHGRCPACNVDFPLDFAQSLELVFRVSPEIRASEVRSYCVGGPAFAPHVVAQVRLAPQARIVLDLALGVGSYKVRALQLADAFPLQISNAAHGHRGRVQFSPAAPPLHGRELLGPGVQNLEIENQTERELVVRVERSAPREDALTAARAACLASFRKLFPGEVLASGRLVAVGRPAFMVCAVYQQRQLMSELGDARAFEQILTHLQWIEDATVAEGGAMVKTASGATLCAFDSASAAVRAAMALRARLDLAQNQPGPVRPLDIRIVAHQGPAVAATLDGRLDYFGHTVESALDLVAHAPPGRVLLSESLAEDQNALADLTSAGHGLELVQLGADGGDCLLARAQLEDAA